MSSKNSFWDYNFIKNFMLKAFKTSLLIAENIWLVHVVQKYEWAFFTVLIYTAFIIKMWNKYHSKNFIHLESLAA